MTTTTTIPENTPTTNLTPTPTKAVKTVEQEYQVLISINGLYVGQKVKKSDPRLGAKIAYAYKDGKIDKYYIDYLLETKRIEAVI